LIWSIQLQQLKGKLQSQKKIREKYKIKAGTKIAFAERDGKIILQAMTKEYFQSLAGWLKGGGSLDDLMEEKKFVIAHDEKRCHSHHSEKRNFDNR
jgi:bifunctional DNA-binding transcriptional regulator/antitoxin component of YhaV-PrlF toxin-antitoxin module